MNPRNRKILFGSLLLLVIIVALITFTLRQGKSKSTSVSKIVKIGLMPGGKQEDAIWKKVQKNAKDQFGITLKFVNFTDGDQPNKALTNHEVDLNAFQHYAYLKSWNKANNGNIVSIGDTIITPIHLYSTKYKNVTEIPDKSTIAIPNDVTNESRALYVLKNAGLIKLDTSRGALATVKDIRDNPKGLIIKEIDASQTPRALDSVAAAVINYNFAISAKISEKESIYQEPLNEDSAQWINFIAANQSDKNNKVYKEVVKAYEQKNIADTIKKEYPDGGELPAWNLKL
ncbi:MULTISPECIES: MetQ/NlpA family ABC transporter substrate-binding protein [Lactococcus]|jgi:D-methionine transport system substrate-binding protein|uniref:Lipoprotein n=1 Tax=Lactococcus lactis TaxID=1358 RepID=A0AAW8UB73_9LACT|nr:MetQ/NlpA family ABC transporter substrate-binding protein [Lactococcus lactis]MDT2861790.1 MetQ/NlpA family ABC transporter substrate-binding protein [Lactococcus lactis]MDT2870123.1 MetQ/NlpA family ABC transporter substrate-binding protein [Lactococcus lactis]MDT2880717.1 MetQ/NlpA family ABC transporter substrate-binding protein [Lactococcus lactis]MDT2886527.1 MetQ/NlpA family ABC transporter substrate-binding protein [Lactococcus lactis]MDT2889264.1 MetQ/NlpA family ABC transporter su